MRVSALRMLKRNTKNTIYGYDRGDDCVNLSMSRMFGSSCSPRLVKAQTSMQLTCCKQSLAQRLCGLPLLLSLSP